MRDHKQPQPARYWILFTAGFLALMTAVFMTQSFVSASGETPVATYANGILHVSIPYKADRAGAGRLQIDVLNPEDEVLGHVEQPAIAVSGQGQWKADVKLARGLKGSRKPGRHPKSVKQLRGTFKPGPRPKEKKT